MTNSDQHSRRDFLQGRAAVRALTDKAQTWFDAGAELLGVASPSSVALHLHASRRAMACEFSVQFHEADREASEAMLDAFDIIESLETQMTVYREQSEVIEINQKASESSIEVEPRLFALFELAATLFCETGGAFDVTSTPLSRVWGFLRREGRIPDENEIAQALEKTGFDKVQLDSHRRTIRFLDPGVEINFNSIGKGYALDRVSEQLDEENVTDYLWQGGGSSVLARGCNRADRMGAWTLGLRHPIKPEHRLAEFHLRDQALATAGGATQFFEFEGQRYSHIIDPRIGRPAEGVFTSTVLAPTAAEADALATAFFVMGAEATKEYCASHPAIGAVLVCPERGTDDISIHDYGMTKDSWTKLDE